jgi:hypothetical protein
MDEGSGTTMVDSSGNNNYGTLVGSDISWTTGQSNGGIHLTTIPGGAPSGGGSAVVLSNPNVFARANFTFQMDLKWDGLSERPIAGDNTAGIILDNDGSNAFLRTRFNDQDPAQNKIDTIFGVYTGGGWLEISTSNAYAMAANQWYNLAVTCKELVGGGTQLQILINGVLAGQGTSTFSPFGGSGTSYIGRANSWISFGGTLDEVRVLDYAIPEPATLSLLMLGGLALLRRTKK